MALYRNKEINLRNATKEQELIAILKDTCNVLNKAVKDLLKLNKDYNTYDIDNTLETLMDYIDENDNYKEYAVEKGLFDTEEDYDKFYSNEYNKIMED